MTRALVVGATGMLGGQLVEALLADGLAVSAYVRPSRRADRLEGLPVEVHYGDALDADAIEKAVAGAEWVFHAAGHVNVGSPFDSSGASPLYQAANVDFVRLVLDACLQAGVKRFVYAGSASVYAIDAPIPTPEDAQLRPMSDYGRSKLQAEGLIRAYQSRGLDGTIVRPCMMYGPGDRHFLPIALNLARLPLLPMVNGGRNLFDLVHARDVAQVMGHSARVEAASGRVYNAGPGAPTTLRDLIETYRQLTGRGPRIVPVTIGAARRSAWLSRRVVARVVPDAAAVLSPSGLDLMAADLQIDSSRAANELGYAPQFDLKRGIAATLAHVKRPEDSRDPVRVRPGPQIRRQQ